MRTDVAHDDKRFITVNLWRTEDDAFAGCRAIGARVQQLLKPLMTLLPSSLPSAKTALSSTRG